MKKKILLSSYNLDIGGIETSLINMIKIIDYSKYDVTLLLEKKEGIFLNKIPDEVKIIEYNTFNNKNILIRKIKNRIKFIYNIIKYKNKFDFAGLYAPYLGPEATIVRHASKNNAIWIHSNYYDTYKKDIKKIKEFFDKRNIEKYNKVIFVSNEAKKDLCKVYPNIQHKSYVLGNVVDYKLIKELSNEKISEKFNKPLIVFVGRLDESSKRLTLLINSLNSIKDNYECLIIGDGPDKKMYKELINKNNLSNKIKLLGKKSNPYPYIKKSDVVVLTSYYEGFPVILVESIILNKPFISTINASNRYLNLKDYGYIVSEKEFANKLKELIKKSSSPKEFYIREYMDKICKDLKHLMEEK